MNGRAAATDCECKRGEASANRQANTPGFKINATAGLKFLRIRSSQ
jgi:hypothetical protein